MKHPNLLDTLAIIDRANNPVPVPHFERILFCQKWATDEQLQAIEWTLENLSYDERETLAVGEMRDKEALLKSHPELELTNKFLNWYFEPYPRRAKEPWYERELISK